jgi:hypothetical protein
MLRSDDVPLICDIPPGGFLLVTVDRPLSEEQAQMLRATIRHGVLTGVLVLGPGIRVERIDHRQWPDAEFCAA